ncbi:MAG: DUF72 domain-containing protein [Nitrospiraceae bacterium]|nr:DUF72 domain-containing protein [Nitrospiraceae bacterium]
MHWRYVSPINSLIRIGTCSWTEKSLIQSGEFYPKNVKTAESRLKFYAEHFNVVEVDSTYYAIPTKSNAYLWADRTPKDFLFHIKVYGALTGHAVDPRTLPPDVRNELPGKDKGLKQVWVKEPELVRAITDKFMEALHPLVSAGKLGVMVFQFPPWFTYKSENLDFILKRKGLIGRYRMAAEFRHGSWYASDVREKVFHFLRKNQIIHVVADEPQYGTLATVPFVPQTTADMAYYRFHGRNKENWLKKGLETSLRYAYEYSDKELMEFIPHIETSAKMATETHVMFNNCHGGYAMRNAQKMKVMCG